MSTLMNNAAQLASEMTPLLRQHHELDAAVALEHLAAELKTPHAVTAARKCLAWWSGMGSLNDLVLHKNGIPEVDANQSFDQLRAQLFLALKQIATDRS